MTARRLLAAAALAALAACAKTSAPTPGMNLSSPGGVAVFRGVVSEYADNKAHPYIAIANAGTNELTIVDAVNNLPIPGPFPLRGLVYPAPGSPTLLAAGDLGDVDPSGSSTGGPIARPDLLVAVPSASSALQVFRTWRADGAIVGQVDLGHDIVALVALDFDPAAPGTVQVAAVLADQRVALVTFRRAVSGPDPDAIDTVAAQASVKVSARLAFQPEAIARSPFQRGQVWVASRDDLGGGTFGVAGLDLAAMADGGTPAIVPLDAKAPTRLVAAAQVRERRPDEDSAELDAALLGSTGFTPPPLSNRVYAVLDESACGVDRAVACGLVALDPGTGRIAADLAAGSPAPRAAIPVPGPLALAVSGPPAVPPPEDARYATSIMRIMTSLGSSASSAAAGVAASDGTIWFVDLSRWEVPSHQLLQSNMSVSAAVYQPPAQVPAIPKDQWLVLVDPANPTTAIKHADTSALAAAVVTTPGYTPSETYWTILSEGALPHLAGRKAEAGVDGTGLWLALQSPGGAGDVVRVWDPTLGVQAGDIVLVDAVGLGTCGQFEAAVSSVEPPRASPAAPGGFLRLTSRGTSDPRNPTWDACLARLHDAAAALAAGTFTEMYVSLRAGGFVLLRGSGTTQAVVGRPLVTTPPTPFELRWSDEAAVSCTLPPAVPWPTAGFPACADAACRAPCFELVKIHHARRIGYVSEACSTTACGSAAGARWPIWPDPVGPALGFTLALESSAPVHRDLALVLSTSDGRAPLREALTTGSGLDARAVVPFDRSPYRSEAGVRFLVTYPAGFVLDGSPTEDGGANELK